MSAGTRYYDALTGTALPAAPADCWKVDDGHAPAYLVGPAFFDPQINGFAGVDFQQPEVTREQLEHATMELRRGGCAHFLLTVITAETDFLGGHFRRLAELVSGSSLLREAIPGFHLEGPFISPEAGYRGAHPVQHVRPADFALFQRWQSAAGGRIRLVTVAPECENAIPFIRQAAACGVFVCLGHTNASLAELTAAVEAGARLFVHLGNAAPPQMNRYDNIVQRVLAMPDLLVSLIPDGLHVPAPALANIVRLLGPARVVMTTDAASPAGAPPGRYCFGRLELEVGLDGVVRLPGTDQYAGSALTPLAGFYNCVRFGGLSADGAWRAWTRMRRVLFPDLGSPALMLPLGCD